MFGRLHILGRDDNNYFVIITVVTTYRLLLDLFAAIVSLSHAIALFLFAGKRLLAWIGVTKAPLLLFRYR